MYFYTMATTAEFLSLIEHRRAELGLSQVDVGRMVCGKADNSVIQNLKKGASPTLDNMTAICRALGIDFQIGLPPPAARPGLSDPAATPSLAMSDAARLGYAPMPWHDDASRKGPVPLAFSRIWMEQQGLVPDNLRIVVPDDVSIPGAGKGAAVALVDASFRKPAGPALWCYSERGRAVLADIHGSAKVIVIRAQDRTRGDRILQGSECAAIRLLGRVLWWGHMAID